MTYFRVTSGHLRSRDVTSSDVNTYCEVQPCRKLNDSTCKFSVFYSHLQPTSGQMLSLPGHLRTPEVTWRHFLSRDCFLLRAAGL